MKIIRRDEFLKLPEGIIYAKGREWYFGNLNIKGESFDHDWYTLDVCWIEAFDDEEQFSRLEDMIKNGASYPMQESACRDGMFEEDALFLIFERDDLLKLQDYIQQALERA